MVKQRRPGVTGRSKVKAKSLATRISGFSLPIIGGGLQWRPTESERDIVRKLLAFLEDRRALYTDYFGEIEEYVEDSVLRIREELTKTLQALPEGSHAAGPVRAMRAACRKFLGENDANLGRLERNDHLPPSYMGGLPRFFVTLGELRASFGVQIAALAFAYDIDVEPELASILPAEADNEDT